MKTKIKKQNTFIRIFKMFDKKDKIISLVALFFVGCSAICDIINPYFTADIMNQISDNLKNGSISISISDIPWNTFGLLLGLAVASIISQSISVLLSMMVATKNTAKFRSLMFVRTRYLSSQDVNEIGSGSILTRITSDVTQIEQFLINYNTMVFKGVFFFIGGLIMSIYQLASYNGDSKIWFATLAYLFIVLFLVITGLMVKRAMKYYAKGRQAVDNNNLQMQENIIGDKLIRSLNLQNRQARKYRKGNKELFEFYIKSERIIALLQPIVFSLINFAMIAIYLTGGMYAWNAPVSEALKTIELTGIIISFAQYIMIITLGLILFATFGYVISRAKVSSERMFEILDKETSIKESLNPKDIKNGEIEFKNVSFKYDKASQEKKYTINNVSFKIASGQSLGIIGQTGSGKSSLIKLLTRLYEIDKGSISISGIDIKDISFKSLRNDISVSLQEKIILKGTFKSNILIGKTDASEKEVIEAAKNAEAWEYISKKEDGINGIVEERGSNLSGGQKQRLSIARALIKDAKILIIDDSTSALDTITERKILNNLDKKFKGVTKIIISQKVKSIQNCDNIIVLDQGKIVQQGKHEELLKNKKGIYRQISDSQKTSLEG